MSKPKAGDKPDLKAKILEILEANRTMSVATVRPDGWPQVTVVGFVHDDLTLFFAIARNSQKLANITHDPRISIAVGAHRADSGDIRGLSMAAIATEITAVVEAERLNGLIAARYPEKAVFAPRGASVALMKATPEIISVVDPTDGLEQPVLLQVGLATSVSPYVPPETPLPAGVQSWEHG
jgi:uncharacterized pyridoxamine 5'-phosphate oxidase family protein